MASLYSLYGKREAGILSDTLYWKATRDSVNLIKRLAMTRILKGHHGCVNTISWNDSGSCLLTGADDRHLKVYDVHTQLELKSILTTHQSNIFSAKFLPSVHGETGIRAVSCAGIGSVEYSEITPSGDYISHPFNCNRSITYQVAATPGDGNEFMTCEEKGFVRLYDLRVKTECSCDGCKKDILYSFPASVSSMAVHPISPYYIAFGLGDGSVQVLDRRMINGSLWQGQQQQQQQDHFRNPSLPNSIHRKYTIGNDARKITSIQFNHDGSQLLASYSEDYVYLFNSRLFGGGSGTSSSSSIIKPVYFSQCECYSPAVPRKRKSGLKVRMDTGDPERTRGFMSNFVSSSSSKKPPPVKKLRLRGDWSDTGPEARPEAEGAQSEGRTLMNRMSHMFAQWIDMSLSSNEQGREGEAGGRGSRRRDERRRRQDRGRGENVAGGSEEQLQEDDVGDSVRTTDSLNSSTSSDNSFSLFEDGNTSAASNSSSSLLQGDHIGSLSEGGSKRDKEEDMNKKDDGLMPFNFVTRSSGKCTKNELTSETECTDGALKLEERLKDKTEDPKCDALPLHKRVQSSEMPMSRSGMSPSSPNDSEGSAVLIENRSLGGEIPSINVIEDETDSDDDDDGVDGKSCDQSRDCAADSGDACDFEDQTKSFEEEERTSLEGCIKPFMVYKGHRNSRTMIKQANFFGDNWILSGSDCGRMFVWDKWSGEVVNMLLADSHVVNCVQPHPHSYTIATSGIDYNVKLWEPVDKDLCSLKDLKKVIECNNVMLEESRNTVTMPSMIFLRVLSYLNRRRRMRDEEENDQDDTAT